ncbi:MAG: metallophosphoesterase [Pigmentiphaga sp.]|uniref:metallophosphoesterase n=1 Tax=Pigmentiphaga sp. TaxID=1977564 RepID=UPI0029B4B48C|nr:metallophosphoesterase [Pigmentiphaga sp.]MDX3906434.1 metallophosphoesterase [Pigmentiphaga sp.]
MSQRRLLHRYYFFGLDGLVHAYVGLRLVPDLDAFPGLGAALAIVLVLSAILIPTSMLARRRSAGPGLRAAMWLGLLCMGLFSSLLVLTLLRDVVLAAASALALFLPAWQPGGLAGASAEFVLAAACFMSVAGFVGARRVARVTTVDIPVAGLPPALEGFTIAQISDIHVGPTIRESYVRRIVETVNGLRADMVAITGDLVDGSVPDLAQHVRPLGGLSSRHGTFFVTGNHEYYAGAHAWVEALRGLGMRVLLNEHAVVRHAGHAIVIAGITDFSAHQFDPAHRSDPQRAIAGAPADAAVKVVLAHQPRSAALTAPAGFDLQLSGHTHGGQFLPWNFLVPLQQPYVQGLHREQRMWVYINRGTGYWGPPMRFGVPSEITLLRLVRDDKVTRPHSKEHP